MIKQDLKNNSEGFEEAVCIQTKKTNQAKQQWQQQKHFAPWSCGLAFKEGSKARQKTAGLAKWVSYPELKMLLLFPF